MKSAVAEIKRLRSIAEGMQGSAFSDREIRKLLDDVLESLRSLIPRAKCKRPGKKNKWVYNFGIKGLPLVMVERPHGNRDAIPSFWRGKQIKAVLELLDYLEGRIRSIGP